MASYAAGTSMLRANDIKKRWLVVDAKGATLGRLASRIAMVLRGKNKASYTPHMNCGDNVIVINAKHVNVTGNKLQNRSFFWYTGHPGGIKEKKWGDIIDGEFPSRLLKKAVERMMPKDSPLARQQMKSLYLYDEKEHPHQGQNPETVIL